MLSEASPISPQHVDDLLGGLDVELRLYFFVPIISDPPVCLGRYMNVVRYQLAVVLVGSHHIGGDALSSGFGGKRAYHVVCLINHYLEDGDAVGVDDILYNRYGEADGLGRLPSRCAFVLLRKASWRKVGPDGSKATLCVGFSF